MKLYRASRQAPLSGAFTLIELLVVVAIISILAAIAVPNFLQAQMRAKVARSHADIRSLMLAIETYHVDYEHYPVRRNTLATIQPHVPQLDTRLPQMSRLTTPIGYMTMLPTDVFESNIHWPNNVIDYYDAHQHSWLVNSRRATQVGRISPGEAGYLLVSVGPDGYLGPLPNRYGWPTNQYMIGTIYFAYDPTNGAASMGNIYIGASSDAEKTAAQFTSRMPNQ